MSKKKTKTKTTDDTGAGAPKPMNIDTVERQRRYVTNQQQKGNGLGVVFADAFLRGMRDIGYKSPAWALAEDIDNSFQAGADTVSLRLGFTAKNKNKTKPDYVALCDNGNGMIPEMISYAVRWGGTDREDDRTGFGRYGYGLPSSAVSMAKRYTVYSKSPGENWYAVTVDIDELAAAASDLEKTQELLRAKPAILPKWLLKEETELNLAELGSGTVIVFEDLDRLRRLAGWIKAKTLEAKLLKYFGVIYRHWVPSRRILVNGKAVQAVDPLFLMEHGRFFSANSVRAERVETRTLEVETSRGTTGTVTIRASLLPPNFQLKDPSEYGNRGAELIKGRWEIMREYNGLLICRERRQIDCISPPWTKFQNYDVNVKIEIDFDPELDEFFGITTAKQQIIVDDDMWQKLLSTGKVGGALRDLVRDMRSRRSELDISLKAEAHNQESVEAPRPSAEAMEASAKFKEPSPEPSPEQREESERNLDDQAAKEAAATRQPKEKVREQLVEHTKEKKWEVDFASIVEGPFYRPKRLGEQKRVILNTDHPFYVKIFEPAAVEVRSALEVLLFVLAERELDARGDAETFYKAERQRWSERLRHALDELVADESITDMASAFAERLHVVTATAPGAGT